MLTDKESKTENIQDTSQDIVENINAIEETKNIDVTEEIKNIDVVEETKNIDIAEEIKNIDIAQELDLKSITKEKNKCAPSRLKLVFYQSFL